MIGINCLILLFESFEWTPFHTILSYNVISWMCWLVLHSSTQWAVLPFSLLCAWTAFPPSNCWWRSLLSSFGWSCFHLLMLGAVSPPPFRWCCFHFPSLGGGARHIHMLMLPCACESVILTICSFWIKLCFSVRAIQCVTSLDNTDFVDVWPFSLSHVVYSVVRDLWARFRAAMVAAPTRSCG